MSEEHLNYQQVDNVHKESSPLTPTLNYIFWDHEVENIEAMYPVLQSADVLAVESVGGTHTQRERLTVLANLITSSSTEPRQVDFALAELEDLTGGPSYSPAAALAVSLEASNKKIHLIDFDAENTYLHLSDMVLEATNEELQVAMAYSSCEEVQAKYLTFLKAQASQSIERESKMRGQLQNIVEGNPGRVVTAVIGSTHTPIYHALASVYQGSRTFISNATRNSGKSQFLFNPVEQAVRALTIRPEAPISSDIVKRALLQLIYLQESDNPDQAADKAREVPTHVLGEELTTSLAFMQRAFHSARLDNHG